MTEPVWLDGTQEPPPQPLSPDPLAGLLTGEVPPGASPEPWKLRVVPPPPVPTVEPAIRAVFTESQPARPRPQTRRPAVGYRPRLRQSPPKANGRVVLITWLVLLFVLFLVARAVISGITGN